MSKEAVALHNRSKSTLFLMEQLIVILIFAICAAVCVQIFVSSYLTTVESKDRSNALIAAESCAESYKATFGNLAETAELLGGELSPEADAIAVLYDKQWQVCGEADAVYILRLTAARPAADSSLVLGDIFVFKNTDKEAIVAFTTAARRGQHE